MRETESEKERESKGKRRNAGVMRAAVEYVVGIFHGSIMAIQSAGGGGECGWRESRSAVGIRRFDVRANVGTRFIRRRAPRSGDVLSNALSIHPGGIPPVFSFRFRATERRKVRDGVLAGRDEKEGRKEGRSTGG